MIACRSGMRHEDRPLIPVQETEAPDTQAETADMGALSCLKDPETPLLARVVIAIAVAYAVSPVDLIPDFIPVLGYVDDLVILPLLIGLAIKLIPPEVRARTRREAWKRLSSGERVQTSAGIAASVVFVCLWIAVIALFARLFFFRSR